MTKAGRNLNVTAVFFEHPAGYAIKYNSSYVKIMQHGLKRFYRGEKAGEPSGEDIPCMLLHFCPSTGTPNTKSTSRVLPVVLNMSDECSILLQPPSKNP